MSPTAVNQSQTRLTHQFLARLAHEVFPVELGRHGAPHFGTLHPRDEAPLLQFQPVRLVQLRADQEIQISDFVIFSE